jgi:hypothetical protein
MSLGFGTHERGQFFPNWRLARLVAQILLWAFVSSPAGALPLPTRLIAEKNFTEGQHSVVFENIGKRVPHGSKHLVIEILAGASGNDDGLKTVKLEFNNDNDSNYLNRALNFEDDKVSTRVSTADTAATLMRLAPSDGQTMSTGQIVIPWAFLDSQKKHALIHSAANEQYVSSSMSHWASTDPISTIRLYLEDGEFVVGSSIRLYAVDEAQLVGEKINLEHEGTIGFSDFVDETRDGLVVIGQTRSNAVNPQRRGDRVWYSINGDRKKRHYKVQRLTGEAKPYQAGKPTAQNKILANQIAEPRVGWNAAATAPDGVFGPWLLYYPQPTNPNSWRTFLSRHGVHDNHYNPVGNEVGRWSSSGSIEDLLFFPQGGEAFEVGSRIGLYRTKKPLQRYVVQTRERSVTLDIPYHREELHIHVAARSEYPGSKRDQLLFEFNDDHDGEHYAHQQATAFGGVGKAQRSSGGEIGILPSADSPDRLMSNIYVSFVGTCDDRKQTSFRSYGGSAESGIGFYGGRWKRTDNIVRVTFRTKSGTPFSKGSVFTIWEDNSYPNYQNTRRRCGEAGIGNSFLMVGLPWLLLIVGLVVFWFCKGKRKNGLRRDRQIRGVVTKHS